MFIIVCSKCKNKIFTGDEVRSPKQILRLYHGKCKRCGAELDSEDFEIQVIESI
jgi:DNA-directed RNA polymerase subunit RPC12/RpoP